MPPAATSHSASAPHANARYCFHGNGDAGSAAMLMTLSSTRVVLEARNGSPSRNAPLPRTADTRAPDAWLTTSALHRPSPSTAASEVAQYAMPRAQFVEPS